MSDWNGEERRHKDKDHDLIVEMHTMLKSIEKNHDRHVEDDDKHFGRLYRGQANLRWYIGMGIGILSAIEFFTRMHG